MNGRCTGIGVLIAVLIVAALLVLGLLAMPARYKPSPGDMRLAWDECYRDLREFWKVEGPFPSYTELAVTYIGDSEYNLPTYRVISYYHGTNLNTGKPVIVGFICNAVRHPNARWETMRFTPGNFCEYMSVDERPAMGCEY